MVDQLNHISDADLTLMVSGHMDKPQRDQAQEHLHGCDDCSRRMESLRQTWDQLGEWDVPTPTPDVTEQVLARVTASGRAVSPVKPRAIPRLTRIAAALALSGLLGVVAGTIHRAGSTPDFSLSTSVPIPDQALLLTTFQNGSPAMFAEVILGDLDTLTPDPQSPGETP